jgi:hypothetical protein
MRASALSAGTGPVPAGTDRYRPKKSRGAGTGRYRASGTGPHRREKFPGSRRYENTSTRPIPAGTDRYRPKKARGAGTGRYRISVPIRRQNSLAADSIKPAGPVPACTDRSRVQKAVCSGHPRRIEGLP